MYCDCKHRKIETSCDKLRGGFVLSCDDACLTKQNEVKRITEEQERVKREQEEEKNRLEMEEFDKKFGKKKHKQRKPYIVEEKPNSNAIKLAVASICVGVLATFIYYLLTQ